MNPLSKFSEQLVAAVSEAGKSVVALDVRSRFPASGILWQEDAIVTADHTIKRDDGIKAILPDGRTVSVTVAGRDAGTDIAVLKIAGGTAARPEPAPQESASVGSLVLAVGRGHEGAANAAMGILSAIRGPWQTWRGGHIDRYLRLDMNLYPGLSGAAVVDSEGRLLGLATSALSRIAAVAIPVSTIERVVNELLLKGYISRAYLGVGLQPVTLGNTKATGLMVVSLEADGPAAASGLLLGDIVVRLAGENIADIDDVQAVLSARPAGDTVAVGLIRGGESQELTIALGERPRR